MRDEIRQVIEIAADREAKGEARGQLKGKRETLLRILARAGITLADDERARIGACSDAEALDRWAENVIGARTAAEVLS